MLSSGMNQDRLQLLIKYLTICSLTYIFVTTLYNLSRESNFSQSISGRLN